MSVENKSKPAEKKPRTKAPRRSNSALAAEPVRMLSARVPAQFFWDCQSFAVNNELTTQSLVYSALEHYMRKATPEELETAKTTLGIYDRRRGSAV